MVLGENPYGQLDRAPAGGDPPNALTGQGSDPTHHITLRDIVGNEVGFIITDQAGDLDERTFRRYPIADPAQPYVTEKQEAFSGFGQARFEDNRANYWWSEGVDTTKGQVVLGGRFRYGQGDWRDAAMHQPGDNDDNFRWLQLVNQYLYVAMPFTVGASNWSGATTYVKLWLKRRGASGRFRVRIVADNSNAPTGAVLGTGYVNPASVDVDKDIGLYTRIAVTTSITPQAATKYWVVVDADVDITPTPDNCWEVGTNAQSSSVRKSADDTTYGSGALDFYYRVEGPRQDFTPRFYTYKGQMYFVASYDENYFSEVYMNGWRGVCDPNAGNLDRLVDGTQDWSTGITGDEVVRLMSGPRAGLEQQDWRRVTGGASTYLSVSPNWRFIQQTSDDYIVSGSDYFTEITDSQAAPVLALNITDVAVAEGIVYFCRGNNTDILTHREYNNAGVWRDGRSASDLSWKQASGVQAQFVNVINDPISGPQLWFGENPHTVGTYQPVVCQSEPTTWDNRALNFQSIIQHNGADEALPWTAVTGDVTVFEEAGRVHIDVLVGVITVGGLSIANGGTTYNNGSHEFRIIEAGSSQGAGNQYAARIQVTITGGTITAITAVNYAGHSYTKGATLSCTATGGGGAGDGLFTVSVNGVDGFGTGKLAYANIVDTDGNERSVDLRNMNLLALNMEFNTGSAFSSNVTADTLDDGDINFDLASVADAAETYASISVGGLVLDDKITENEFLSMDLTDFANAATTKAVSLSLTVQKNRSFRLTLDGKTYALRDITPIPVGNLDFDNITGLQSYGDPEALWVMTETGIGEIRNNLFMPLPQRELKIARHPSNGRGSEVSDVYLMFTWRGRLQRYYRQNLEDLGPDFPFELGELEGNIVDIITYPGRLYVAIDGGDQGRSMVLCHKGGGWHEVYTGFAGEHIRALYVQSIPGKSDRLWWCSGSDMMYVNITLNAAELPDNNDYKFRGTGYLTSSWVYTAHAELNKLFRSIVVTMQRANDSDLGVVVQYQLDDEDNDWETTADTKTISASAEEFFFGDLAKGIAKSGNRIRVRLVLESYENSKSPVIRSVQHKMYRLPEVKFAYTFLSKISSLSINLRGDEEKVLGTQQNLVDALALLDNWGATVMPLSVTSNIAALHEKLVIIEPLPTQLLMIVSDEDLEEESIQVALNDA